MLRTVLDTQPKVGRTRERVRTWWLTGPKVAGIKLMEPPVSTTKIRRIRTQTHLPT